MEGGARRLRRGGCILSGEMEWFVLEHMAARYLGEVEALIPNGVLVDGVGRWWYD